MPSPGSRCSCVRQADGDPADAGSAGVLGVEPLRRHVVAYRRERRPRAKGGRSPLRNRPAPQRSIVSETGLLHSREVSMRPAPPAVSRPTIAGLAAGHASLPCLNGDKMGSSCV